MAHVKVLFRNRQVIIENEHTTGATWPACDTVRDDQVVANDEDEERVSVEIIRTDRWKRVCEGSGLVPLLFCLLRSIQLADNFFLVVV